MEIKLPEAEGKYTKADLKLIEYIEMNTEKFLFMSISQLSESTGMSEATISRFARHMGYQDYKELRNGIIKQKTQNGAAGKLAGTLLKDEGFDSYKWFSYQQECLQKTAENIEPEVFSDAVSMVQKAQRIYIHAKNASAAAGQLLFFRLRRLGLDVSVIPSGGSEVMEGIAHAKKGDLVILFSFSKLSKEGSVILDYSHKAGYQTLSFTSRKFIQKEQQADLNLYVYRGEEMEYHSMCTAIAMIDALVLALAEKMQTLSSERLFQIQELKRKYY